MLQGYIRYFRVMLCEKIPVETLCILDPFYGGSGSTLRLADPRRRKALRGGHRAAASLASRHRLSHCLGHFVRTYGDRRSPDLSLPPIRCPLPEPAALFGTAGLQLLLEPSVFQPAALWPSLCLADGAVGADPLDDPVFPQDRSSGRMAPGTLLSVGCFRRLSELRRVAAEPITRKPASAQKSQEALLKASWLLQYGVPERIRTSGLPLRSLAFLLVRYTHHNFPLFLIRYDIVWLLVNLHKNP